MKLILHKMLLVICILLVSTQLSFGQNLEDKQYDIGFTGAYWLSGDITIEGFDVEKDGSFLLRAFADFYLMPKLAMGVFANFSPYSQEGLDITLYEIGGSIKPRFFIGDGLAIKPGLNLGYRFTTADFEFAEISGLGVNVSVEIQKALDTFMLHGEIGFLSQPAGGNSDADVTFAPIIYIGAGISF